LAVWCRSAASLSPSQVGERCFCSVRQMGVFAWSRMGGVLCVRSTRSCTRRSCGREAKGGGAGRREREGGRRRRARAPPPPPPPGLGFCVWVLSLFAIFAPAPTSARPPSRETFGGRRCARLAADEVFLLSLRSSSSSGAGGPTAARGEQSRKSATFLHSQPQHAASGPKRSCPFLGGVGRLLASLPASRRRTRERRGASFEIRPAAVVGSTPRLFLALTRSLSPRHTTYTPPTPPDHHL
jgi:hypothetical protein